MEASNPLAARGPRVTDFAAYYAALAKEFNLDSTRQVTSSLHFPQTTAPAPAPAVQTDEELMRNAAEAAKGTVDLDALPYGGIAMGDGAAEATRRRRRTRAADVHIPTSDAGSAKRPRRAAARSSAPAK